MRVQCSRIFLFHFRRAQIAEKTIKGTRPHTRSTAMDRMASDDLQILQTRNRSPPRSPFLAALLRRQSKTDPKYPDINFKEQRRIVVMGAAKVGKSCIVHKFLYDRFTPKYSRTIEDLHVADYNLSTGASLTLEILDTTGSYQFPAMRALSISNANAFVLVYSVGDLESWQRVHDLRYEVSVEHLTVLLHRLSIVLGIRNRKFQ